MDKDFKRFIDFLIGMGIEQVPHTHKSYLVHLIAVFRSLESLSCPEDVCRAGMFHSIYGTERF
jgi:(p)ppGpp synthase/HD superfamily hydrolase